MFWPSYWPLYGLSLKVRKDEKQEISQGSNARKRHRIKTCISAAVRAEPNKARGCSMIIACMTFTLRAPWVHSLKEKRMIVKSLVSRLHNRFNVSASEIDEQDTHQIIVIGVAAIVPHSAMADSIMEEISAFVEENTDAEIIGEEREIL